MIGAAKPEITITTGAEHFHTAYIYAISAVAALGGLLFGYDWVVIGGNELRAGWLFGRGAYLRMAE
jgi:uncharacterized membrane protein YedE/YeeE